MKPWVTLAVLVALLLDVTLFLGVGFGVGALSITAPATTQTANQYSAGSDCSPANAISNPGGTYLASCVNASLPNVANTGETPTSTILPNGLSTDISFSGSVQQFYESGQPL